MQQLTLVDVFRRSTVLTDLEAKDKKSVIKALVRHMVDKKLLKDEAEKKAERAVLKRESQGSTAIGKGLAIPHAKGCGFVDDIVGVFARSRTGIPFDAVDGGVVHVFFMVLSPEHMASEHTQIMKRVAKLLFDEKTIRYLATDEHLESLEEIFKEVDDHFS